MCGIKTVKTYVGLIVLAGVVCSGSAYAQASSQPPTSAMVTPKNDANPDWNIEPRKPNIAEETTDTDTAIAADPSSLLPDLPPVPKSNATLIGGTVEHLDRVRDRLVVRPFGGGKMTILYDPRTTVSRGNKDASLADLREGERVYLDTILDGSTVFARAIRLSGPRATGDTQGVVVKYRTDREQLTIRDSMSPSAIQVQVTTSTKVKQGDREISASLLAPGALVAIQFASDGSGHNSAREISVLAMPGAHYNFSGQVVHIDLRTGLLVINSATDHKTYEVYLDPSVTPDENLQPGSTVTVVTNFDGTRYVARHVTINSQ